MGDEAIYINQNGNFPAIWIVWFTCLDCGWQSMTIAKDEQDRQRLIREKKDTCYLCGSNDVKYRDEDEEFFTNISERLLKDKNTDKLNFMERMFGLKIKKLFREVIK